MPQATKTDPKQAFIKYAERTTSADPRPWSENGECWVTGEGLEPIEFPLLPRWDDPNRDIAQIP